MPTARRSSRLGVRSSRLALAALLALSMFAAAVVWWGLGEARSPAGEPVAAAGEVAAAPPQPAGEAAGPLAAAPHPETEAPKAPGAFGADDPARAWAGVDMEAVRAAMPENLYWKLAMPTDDASVLREREEIRAHWNEQYGKVLSNTASESELRDYFAHRRRLSADYVAFASHLLDHYGKILPERDVGLLELAREMHLARLEEIPGKISEALERHAAHEAARQAWLEEEARLEDEAAGAPTALE